MDRAASWVRIMSARAVAALRRRLNAAAYDLLCDEIARLDAENERLRERLQYAEQCAEMWQRDAIEAIEQSGCAPGLTIDGQIVAVAS